MTPNLRKKLVICGAIYSANLGDGVIAECLRHELAGRLPECEIELLDIAGRTKFSTDDVVAGGKLFSRQRLLGTLGRLPKPLRNAITYRAVSYLVHRKALPVWRQALAEADYLVIGGGQLFSVVDMNFPTKLAALLDLTRERRIPTSFHACGGGWAGSSHANRLLTAALSQLNVRSVCVRDDASQSAIQTLLAPVRKEVLLGVDPAVHVEAVYPAAKKATPTFDVGIGISDPRELCLGGDFSARGRQVLAIVKDFALALAERGQRVCLFTNGAHHDELTLQAIWRDDASLRAHPRIARLPHPKTPRELVEHIASCRAVVAHRLHANIIALGLRVPSVGLGWDKKVAAFFARIGREPAFVPASRTSLDALQHALQYSAGSAADPSALQSLSASSLDALASEVRDALHLPASVEAAASPSEQYA